MRKKLSRSSEVVWLATIILLYTMPIVVILFNLIDFAFRFVILLLMALALAGIAWLRGANWRALGFRLDNLVPALLANSALFAGLAILLVIFASDAGRYDNSDMGVVFFVFYVFVSAPAQEFIFRSYLHFEWARGGTPATLFYILGSSALYAFMHAIYADVSIVTGTFVLGLVWGGIYAWKPNFYAVAIAHAAFGWVAFMHGLA